MDFISHALIGKILCYFDKKIRASQQWIVILFSVLPDFVLIPFYIILGKENERFLWIAQNEDWIGIDISHPILSGLYNTTHSIFFAFLIILPIVYFFKFPKMAFLAYLLHIIIDVFAHTGEWAIKIFFPYSFDIDGFTNVWMWPISTMIISWAILSVIILYISQKNDGARHKD